MKNASPLKKGPFILREIPADMTRKHSKISKGARALWVTMRGMADAKTGELRHREHWYSGKQIDFRAEISDRTRKPLMKELVLAGLVRWERERIRRLLKDRLTGRLRWRCVSGRTKYFVFKSPHKDCFSYTAEQKSPRKHWSPSKVQFPRPLESRNTPDKTEGRNEKSPHKHWPSSKVKSLHGARISPASLSVLHQEGDVGVSGSVFEGSSLDGSPVGAALVSAVESGIGNEGENLSQSSSVSGNAPVEKTDDDLRDIPSRAELLLEKAKNILISKGHERDYIETALDWIDQRSFALGKTPVSVAYYLAAFETLEENPTEKDLVWDHVKKRRALYAKFGIPLDVTKLQLTPEQEKARQSFNQLSPRRQNGSD